MVHFGAIMVNFGPLPSLMEANLDPAWGALQPLLSAPKCFNGTRHSARPVLDLVRHARMED